MSDDNKQYTTIKYSAVSRKKQFKKSLAHYTVHNQRFNNRRLYLHTSLLNVCLLCRHTYMLYDHATFNGIFISQSMSRLFDLFTRAQMDYPFYVNLLCIIFLIPQLPKLICNTHVQYIASYGLCDKRSVVCGLCW